MKKWFSFILLFGLVGCSGGGATEPVASPEIVQVAFADAARGWLALSDGQVLSTADGGINWGVAEQLTDLTRIGFSGALGWAEGPGGRWLSQDGGASWQAVTGEWPGVVVGGVDPSFLYGVQGTTLLLSQDLGETWVEQQGPCQDAVQYAFVSPQLGWALCSFGPGGSVMTKELYQTSDGGARWSLLQVSEGHPVGGLPESDQPVSLFFLNPASGWFVGSHYGNLVQTQDGGHNWTQLESPFLSARGLRFLDAGFGYGWGRNLDGWVVLTTADGGASWQRLFLLE